MTQRKNMDLPTLRKSVFAATFPQDRRPRYDWRSQARRVAGDSWLRDDQRPPSHDTQRAACRIFSFLHYCAAPSASTPLRC